MRPWPRWILGRFFSMAIVGCDDCDWFVWILGRAVYRSHWGVVAASAADLSIPNVGRSLAA